MLKKHKVDIHSPSEDQCDTCVSFNLRAFSKEQYGKHFIKVNEACEAKNVVKTSGSENGHNHHHDGPSKHPFSIKDTCV